MTSADFIVGALTLFSILIVLFVPSFEGSMLYLSEISPLNWLRFATSVLLTFFLPGYFLLKILDSQKKFEFFALIPLSYIVSLFTVFVIGFSFLLFADSISLDACYVLIVLNLILMVIYCVKSLLKSSRSTVQINLVELVALLSAILVVLVGTVFVMTNTLPLRWGGDMMRHHSQALQYSQGFPVHGGMLIPQEPYLFHTFLAVFFQTSGLPSALSYQLLFSLSFIPILAFHSFVKAWVNKQNVVYFSMLLAPLLGFGSLYAINLGLQNQTVNLATILSDTVSKTYDIKDIMILGLGHANIVPLIYIGLPVLLMFLYLLRKDLNPFVGSLLFAVLVVVVYVGHVSESIFLAFLLIIYALILKGKVVRVGAVGGIVGLLVVFLFDSISPVRHFVFGIGGFSPYSTIVFSATLLLFLASGLISFITKYLNAVYRFVYLGLKKASVAISCGILYCYLFSLIIWLQLLPIYDAITFGHYAYTPFFVWPIRFGVVGLFLVLCIFLYFKEIVNTKSLLFLLSLAVSGFVLEQFTNIFVLHYWPYRFGTLTFLGAVPLASFAIVKLFVSLRKSKKLIFSIVLLVTIILGIFSTCLHYYNNSAACIDLTDDELDALTFISDNVQSNSSVLSFTEESSRRLQAFAGINSVQDVNRWSDLLFSASNPYLIVSILSSSNVKYVYVTQRDIEQLNQSELLSSFVTYFEKVLENDYAIIYEVPTLTSPSDDSTTGVFHLYQGLDLSKNPSWIDHSFTEGWNLERQKGHIKNFSSTVTDGVMEISVTSNSSGNTWVSYSRSNISLNTSTFPSLSFRYHVANSLTWFTFQLWNSTDQVFFYAGGLTAQRFNTRTFELPENQTVTKIEIIVETISDAPSETTATAYLDYVRFSSSVSTWDDYRFTSDWSLYKTRGDLSEYIFHTNGDLLNISVTSNSSGNVWASYYLPLDLVTKDSDLSFTYRVDNSYTWFTIILHNSTNDYFFYCGRLTDRVFTTKYFSLPDGQHITGIEFVVETPDSALPQTTAIAQIDKIEISPRPFSEVDIFSSLLVSRLHSSYDVTYIDNLPNNDIKHYLKNYTNIILTSDPQFSLESLVDWVSDGNTLTVFNTYGNGFFVNFLGLDNSSSKLSVINVGSGKIIFINTLQSLALGKEADLLQSDFLNEIRTVLKRDESLPNVTVLPVYNSTSGFIQVNGNMSCNTDVLKIQGNLAITDPTFPNGTYNSITVYGNVFFSIKNANFSIYPLESSLIVEPTSYTEEGEILLQISDDALIIADETFVISNNFVASLSLKSLHISLSARLPLMNLSGKIIFDRLDVHSALYIPLEGLVSKRTEVQGDVTFKTSWISDPITLFLDFQANGEITNLEETSETPPIPWGNVLMSPYSLLFNALFSVIVITFWLIKKKKTFPF